MKPLSKLTSALLIGAMLLAGCEKAPDGGGTEDSPAHTPQETNADTAAEPIPS